MLHALGRTDPGRSTAIPVTEITLHGQALARKARDSRREFLWQTFATALDDTDLAGIMDRVNGAISPAGTVPHGRSSKTAPPYRHDRRRPIIRPAQITQSSAAPGGDAPPLS